MNRSKEVSFVTGGGGQDRPRLLFLAFAFPPSRAVGALRCWYLAKYLARAGWNVKVVTPDPSLLTDPAPGVDVEMWCRTEGVQRILTGHGWRMLLGGWLRLRVWERSRLGGGLARRLARQLWIDRHIGWRAHAEAACSTLQTGEVDLVMASGPPFLAFEMAAHLGRRLGVPFVLDYRDLWNLAPHQHRESPPRIFRCEQTVLNRASGVMVVSEPMADCLQRRFKLPARPDVVANGFDPDDFRDLRPKVFDDFTVVYAGSFHPPKSVIDPVIAAVKRANQGVSGRRRLIRLHYYGRDAQHVQKAAQAHGASEYLVVHGLVSRQVVLAALRGAGVAVVITSVESKASAADDSLITSKLFEPIGTGTPILLVAPAGTEVVRMVERAGVGQAFSGGQVQPMADWLRQLAGGKVYRKPNVVEEFSWPRIAHRADALLRSLLPVGH